MEIKGIVKEGWSCGRGGRGAMEIERAEGKCK